MAIVPSPGWEELLKRLTSLRGSAFFLGRSDSGKTALIRYLLTQLCASGHPATRSRWSRWSTPTSGNPPWGSQVRLAGAVSEREKG